MLLFLILNFKLFLKEMYYCIIIGVMGRILYELVNIYFYMKVIVFDFLFVI